MTTTKDGMGIEEVITGKAAQPLTVEDVLKGVRIVADILKSPCTPPKEDKQTMAPIHMSP